MQQAMLSITYTWMSNRWVASLCVPFSNIREMSKEIESANCSKIKVSIFRQSADDVRSYDIWFKEALAKREKQQPSSVEWNVMDFLVRHFWFLQRRPTGVRSLFLFAVAVLTLHYILDKGFDRRNTDTVFRQLVTLDNLDNLCFQFFLSLQPLKSLPLSGLFNSIST